jgi:hypothetical protein
MSGLVQAPLASGRQSQLSPSQQAPAPSNVSISGERLPR